MVTADDETAVDALVAQIGGGPRRRRTTKAVRPTRRRSKPSSRLLHAARRLRTDPTDMAADGELAESGAEIFAIDHVYGVDGDVWASIGRVTRRLLAALGADIALEDEISNQAAVLCRLVEPIVSPRGQDAEPWRVAQTARMATTYHPPPLAADDSPDGEAVEEDEVGEEAEEGEGEDRHQVVYDLADWLPEERAQLDLLLERDGIGHWWEGTDVVVAEVDWDQVDALVHRGRPLGRRAPRAGRGSRSRRRGGLPRPVRAVRRRRPAGGRPRRQGQATSLRRCRGVRRRGPVPFGMSDDQWWRIKSRVAVLTDSIEVGAGEVVIRDSATTLSDLLRGFV